MDARKTLLIISQVYVPDPAAVGQQIHDAAAEMVRRGWRVIVYTSGRGYDDPSQRYPLRETLDGVEVRRLRLASFGKGSMAIRLLGGFAFIGQAVARAVWTRGLTGVLVSTSPPMAPLAGVVLSVLRRVPVVYWAMDLNPDQMVAMGKAKPGSLPVRMFDWMNRRILRRASAVVALDRYMAGRLEAKAPVGERMHVLPPWPHDAHTEPVAHEANPFRREHGLDGKFVVMYSGNISPSHPLDTVLGAAKRLRDDPRIAFVFIGGGLGMKRVAEAIEREGLTNAKTLPYQPLDRIRYSLSAADVHLVAMGNEMVGIVHPCKGYGAMAVARPLLLLGPKQSHVGELIARFDIGWQVDHGDVDGAAALIRRIAGLDRAELVAMGERARAAVETGLSGTLMCGRFCDIVEAAIAPRAA